ncbi:MAG TPA: hypothetical protein VG963_08005, partial [Polyangiaceae bacterium]|nr:hypothetical protein [Polyangiaceae bacterium]
GEPSQARVSYTNTPSGRLNARPSQPQPEPAIVPAARSSAFGPSALHDERVLDIPAYLRRNAHE